MGKLDGAKVRIEWKQNDLDLTMTGIVLYVVYSSNTGRSRG